MSSSFLCPVFPFSRFLPQNPFILSKVQMGWNQLILLDIFVAVKFFFDCEE